MDYLNARVDTEVASRTPVIRAAPQSVSSEGLSGVSITGFGERPEFPVAPKYALPIPTAPGMSAEERLRLLLKKRKSEEPPEEAGL